MHVLILPSWYPSHLDDAAGSFFREQALALQKHGCQVGVIYPQHRSLRQWKTIFTGQHGISVELDEGVPTYRYHAMNWFPRLPALRMSVWVAHGMDLFEKYCLNHGRPDIIHVHSILDAGILAKRIKKSHKIKYIITEHSSAYNGNIVSSKRLQAARSAAANADGLLAVSPELCDLLTKKLSIGCGWEFLPNIVNDNFLTKELEVKSDIFEFVSVGFVTPRKRQGNIIRAFASAFPNQPSVQLIIAGDGPELHSLRELATSLGVASRIKFLGYQTRDQVLELMAKAHAFVLASDYETFGVVIVEALALGLPVVATRCGGPDAIVREDDGLLIPVDDVPALAQAMLEIHHNYEKYNAEDIRSACRARFSEERVAQQLKDIYRQVCTGQETKTPCA